MKTPLKKTFSLVSLFVFSATVGFSLVSAAFASHAITSIMLFLDDGAPITTEQSIRVSLWSDGRLAEGDITGGGAINVAAPNYANYNIVLTRTPDSNGRTRIEFAYLTDLPYLTEENQFMMIEYKDSADPDTAYVIYDDTYVGSSMDRFPLINNGPQIFQEIYTNEATTANTFTYDHDDTGGDVILTFGKTLNETFRWDSAQTAFSLSDDLIISGSLDTAGVTSSGVVDFSGASQVRIRESDFVVVPDCADVGELVFDTTLNLLKFCTGTGSPGAWSTVGHSAQDLDDIYDADSDKVLGVDDVSGLTLNASTAGNILFNLQSTGDFVIQDNGTTFALFTDAGLFELSGLENTERLRLTDTTNGDSVGLYVGTGTPDGVITSESGSVYLDELGSLYVNNSVGGSGNTWNKTSLDKAQTVTVAASGADFTSVKAAVDSITDSSALNQYVVQVYPGIYVEDDITLPDFVSIRGVGSVSIVALDPTDTLINAGLGSTVDNVSLSGASGVGGICFRSDTSSILSDSSLSDCETGLLATGAAAFVGGVLLLASEGSFTDVIRVEAGARFQCSQVVVATLGSVSNAMNVDGVGTVVECATFAVLSPTTVNGLYVNNGASVLLLSSTIQYSVNGIHVGPNGASVVRGTGGIVENNSQYTLYVESSSTKLYYDALQTQKEKFNIDPDAQISITFNNTTPGEEGSNVYGRFSVGTPEASHDSYFGEGDPYVNGMLVYTFDGATYTNVTTAAQDSTTTFTFPGVATNNAIYVSSSHHHRDGDFVRFEGFNYTTASTGSSLGAGDIVEEFWNGTSWVAFPKLCFHRTLLYRYDDHCFDRPDSDEVNLFDNNVPLTWVKNDPVTLGTDQYWIRIRIASTILVAPVFQQFKIQPNSTNITHNGSTIFLGDARITNNIVSSPDQIFFASGSNAPSNSSFNVGTGNPYTEDRVRSSFRGSGVNLDEMTGSVVLPKGLDTSTTMNARIHWKKADNAVGNVQWHMNYSVIGPKNVPIVDGSNIATAPRTMGEDLSTVDVKTISTAVEGGTNSNETFQSVFEPGIDVSGHYQGDKLLLRLYRDAADPDDTYTGDAVITGFELNGAFWSLGEAH